MAMELDSYRNQKPKVDLARRLKVLVWITSALVLGLVASMRFFEKPERLDLGFLPPFHAVLNTLAAIGLVMAVKAIRKGRVSLHRKWIYFALGCSLVFLLSYVCYHFTTLETQYGGEGLAKKIYYFILISHISLAALSFPFILLTFVYGFTNHFAQHKKLARIVYPIWLYVAVTGPVVYLLLRPYY